MKQTTASVGFGLLLVWMAVAPARASPIGALFFGANDQVTVYFDGTLASETYWQGIPGDGIQFTEFNLSDSSSSPFAVTIQSQNGSWSSGQDAKTSRVGNQVNVFVFVSDASGSVVPKPGATQNVDIDNDNDASTPTTGSLGSINGQLGSDPGSVPEPANWPPLLMMSLLLAVEGPLRNRSRRWIG